jgi:nicotinate phosphoribosyltransferase
MKVIHEHFQGEHMVSYGWGTLFTNDVEGTIPGDDNYRPFSMACKVVSVNGRPCVKLSNDTSKATGPKDEIARYLKVFGEQHRVTRKTLV